MMMTHTSSLFIIFDTLIPHHIHWRTHRYRDRVGTFPVKFDVSSRQGKMTINDLKYRQLDVGRDIDGRGDAR